MTPVLAHTLTEAGRLGVAPAFVGLAVAVLSIGVARLRVTGEQPVSTPEGGATTDAEAAQSSDGHVPPRWVVVAGRAIGLLLLVLAITAGRIGADAQFDNIAPALVIGVGWPVLLAGSAVLGGVWPWLTPFDTLARGAERLSGGASGAETGPTSGVVVWPASVVGAVAWSWWLAVYVPGGLDPRAIGLGLGVYTILTVGACLAFGRERWLSDGEVFTVTFDAISAARRPRGAPVPPVAVPALGVLIGGLAYAEIRFSSWFIADVSALGLDPFGAPAVVAGFGLAVGVGVASVVGARRWARRHKVEDVVRCALPWLVVGMGLSAAIERDRLWTSLQLLVVRASDPFGTGLDLFGTAGWGVRSWGHGDVWRLSLQVAVLGAAAMAALALGRRRAGRRTADPMVVLVTSWLVLAVLSAASL